MPRVMHSGAGLAVACDLVPDAIWSEGRRSIGKKNQAMLGVVLQALALAPAPSIIGARANSLRVRMNLGGDPICPLLPEPLQESDRQTVTLALG